MAEERRGRRRTPVLGVLAHVLVPGERRRRATGHFRRAGIEVLHGVGALARPDGAGGMSGEPEQRERISID